MGGKIAGTTVAATGIYPVARSAALVAIALLLTGCPPPPRPTDALSCFPRDSRHWIARSGIVPGGAAANGEREGDATTVRNATMYVDRSASMVGYVNGATQANRPFQDVVETIPNSLREINYATKFRAFGRTVSAPMADGSTMLTPGFFSCGTTPRDRCEVVESHLDDVFKMIADKPTELAVVVTDLWFSNSTVDSSALAALQPQLKAILASNRAVAVYGFAAPFSGTIYDLPAVPGQPTSMPHSGQHPLYMLVVGPDADVAAFRSRLERSGSPLIARGVARGGSIRQTLFTASPTVPSALPKAPLSAGASPTISRTVFDSFNGLSVQQFAYDASVRERNGATHPEWSGPDPALFAEHSVWQGATQLRVRVWRQRDEDCTPTSWTEINALAGDWPQVASGGQNRFVLEPRLIRNALRQEGVYVLGGELSRLSIDANSPASAWMNQWSLAPSSSSSSTTPAPIPWQPPPHRAILTPWRAKSPPAT